MNSDLLLRAKLNNIEEPALERSVRAIETSTDSMERLIHDLLDLTKLESGRVSLNLRPCDAEELISSCMKELAATAEAREIELIKEVRSGESIAYKRSGSGHSGLVELGRLGPLHRPQYRVGTWRPDLG